jgi:hypothetical protein
MAIWHPFLVESRVCLSPSPRVSHLLPDVNRPPSKFVRVIHFEAGTAYLRANPVTLTGANGQWHWRLIQARVPRCRSLTQPPWNSLIGRCPFCNFQ